MPARRTLRREIIAILAFKLLALTALYFLFFDEPAPVSPAGVGDRLLDSPAPAETHHD